MKIQNTITKAAGIVLIALVLGACTPRFPTTGWPIDNTATEHEIGNSGGEFQQYSGSPYFHEGIDILDDDAPTGPWVRNVRAGVPTLSLPGAGSLYNGATVAISDGDSYVYWHLDFNSIQQAVRDADDANSDLADNAQIARLVTWTACDYHHLHYEVADGTGSMDPIYTLTPRNDTDSPLVLSVYFAPNTTNSEYPKGALGIPILSGNADVIAKAHDRQFGTARTGVMQLKWWVEDTGGTEVKAPITIRFRNIPADANASVIYRNGGVFDSDSGYCGTEEYFYALSNVDSSGNIISDASGFWDTTAHSNGTYQVWFEASDASGNDFTLIKQVTIDN